MPRNNRRRRSDSATVLNTNTSTIPPRSKAGCWTCRIRRKRCDEQQDESGSCQACNRLHIECLGWGTRRPDWCRDKEKLNQYKLQLKRKLCSRAGTRPSSKSAPASNDPAQSQTGNIEGQAEESVDDMGEEVETDGYEYDDSPLFYSPLSLPTSTPTLSSPSLAALAPRLSALLTASKVPESYAQILSRILELDQQKGHLIEQQVAQRAQAIEIELNRLSHRASFDDLFSSAIGFNIDTTSFLSSVDVYNSPMSMWSPDLMSDAMSTLSTSVPNSPAAPLMSVNAQQSPFMSFDFDDRQPTGLGLTTSELYFPNQSTYPSISLFPPTRTNSYDLPSKPIQSPLQSTLPTDQDPFQIHHSTCHLLLQAVLSSPSSLPSTSPLSFSPHSPLFALPNQQHHDSEPLEEAMQRLISAFQSLSHTAPSDEYLFAATLAGALASSQPRRAFFADLVRRIEARNVGVIGSPLLTMAWGQ